MKLTPTMIAEKVAEATDKAVETHFDRLMRGEKSALFVTADLGFGIHYNIHSSGDVTNERLIMSCTQNGTVLFKIEYPMEYSKEVSPAISALSNVVWAAIDKEQDKVEENA